MRSFSVIMINKFCFARLYLAMVHRSLKTSVAKLEYRALSLVVTIWAYVVVWLLPCVKFFKSINDSSSAKLVRLVTLCLLVEVLDLFKFVLKLIFKLRQFMILRIKRKYDGVE